MSRNQRSDLLETAVIALGRFTFHAYLFPWLYHDPPHLSSETCKLLRGTGLVAHW